MSTSERRLRTQLQALLFASGFLALFGAVYEAFSHGVYSGYMTFAFAVPLLLGVLPYAALLLGKRVPDRVFLNLWNAGIAALSTGCVFRGVLDIYGTTNALVVVYPIAGGALLAMGLVHLALRRRQA